MGVAAELKKTGIVAAVKDEPAFRQALSSPARVIFLLKKRFDDGRRYCKARSRQR